MSPSRPDGSIPDYSDGGKGRTSTATSLPGPTDHDRLISLVKKHEGYSAYPYRCPSGAWTIGYGHNLDSSGLPYEVCVQLLELDLAQAASDARQWLGEECYDNQLTPARRAAAASMSFNMGITRLRSFVKTRAAIVRGDWESAEAEMLNSAWARQVGDGPGQRARELAKMMRTGDWPTQP